MSPLPPEQFRAVVASTPLVSIDLIVVNTDWKLLLGKRRNRPAQGYWFVPGGRIFKGETLDAAFRRLSREELGCEFVRSQASFQGVHEHLYADSVFGESPSTHYVVLAYRLRVEPARLNLPNEQHSDYRWWDVDEASRSRLVHPNTQAYLIPKP